jgi:predicted transcriptional regulator
MEITLPRDLETKLARLADEQGRDTNALVLEAVERLIEYQEWFLREVEAGVAEMKRGETLSHEEVGRRIASHIAHRQQPA